MLNVGSHDSIKTLKKRMRLKEYAEVKDRIFAIVLAMKGHTAASIAERLDYNISWVLKWAARYRDTGFEGLWDSARPGQPRRLTTQQEQEFSKLIEDGPAKESGLSRFRVIDLQKLLLEKFNVRYSLSGVKNLLHRLGFSSIMPRPRHPNNDPEEMEKWKRRAPKVVAKEKKSTRTKKSRSGSRMKPDTDSRES